MPGPFSPRCASRSGGGLLIIAVLMMPGCPGSPTSDLTPAGDSVSAVSIQPGQFLTITDPAIKAGVPVSIEFTGANGYAATFEAHNTQDGSVQVPVPAFIDFAAAAFGAGEMSVGIKGAAPLMKLAVADLPVVDDGTPPGAVMRLVLEESIEQYQYHLAGIAAVQADVGGGLDASSLVTGINQQIAMIQNMIAGYEATGRFTLSGPGGDMTLTDEQMTLADRWLAAILVGMADEMTGGEAVAKGVRSRKAVPPPNPWRDGFLRTVRTGIADVKSHLRQGLGGANVLASAVGLGGAIVCAVGIVASSPGVILVGAVVGVAGAACAFAEGAAGGENSDAFLNRDPKRFSNSTEAASQIVRYGSNAVSAIPGPAGATATAVGLGTAGWDFYRGAASFKCQGTTPKNKQRVLMAELGEAGDVELFCQYVSIPVEQPVNNTQPTNNNNSGAYSPPECPPLEGSKFATRTGSDGKYYEYWTSPYYRDKPVGPFRTWYSIGGAVADQGCRNSDGQMDGFTQGWRPDGSLLVEHNYKNGSLSGWTREYYPNGTVGCEVTYVPVGPQAMPDGVARCYSDTGQLMSETTYILGVQDGPDRSWYSNGQLEFDCMYVNGLPEGACTRYQSNGEIESLWCFVDGRLQPCTTQPAPPPSQP